MRMKLKLGVLFLVSVIASAGISGSYALSFEGFKISDKLDFMEWPDFDYLKIDNIEIPDSGYSSCGKVGVKIVGTDDPGPNFLQDGGRIYPINTPVDGTADPQYNPGVNTEGKNVASTQFCNGQYLFSMKVNNECVKFYKDGAVCVNNAYPWYASGVNLWFGNGGSIPITVSNVKIEVISGSSELLKFLKVHNWEIKICGSVFASGSTFDELKDALKTVRLCPCKVMTLDIDFHFEEEYKDCQETVHIMPQQTTMKFQIILTWQQACC